MRSGPNKRAHKAQQADGMKVQNLTQYQWRSQKFELDLPSLPFPLFLLPSYPLPH